MKYDSDELLYYCYVRSLTQSVLNTHFKIHWSGPLNDPSSVGIDRRPNTLFLNRRECNYIATTIFILNQGNDSEKEHKMFRDFITHIEENLVNNGQNIGSSMFLKIAAERYYAHRPDHQQQASQDGSYQQDNGYENNQEQSQQQQGGHRGSVASHRSSIVSQVQAQAEVNIALQSARNSVADNGYEDNEEQQNYQSNQMDDDDRYEEEQNRQSTEEEQPDEADEMIANHPLLSAIFAENPAPVEQAEYEYISYLMTNDEKLSMLPDNIKDEVEKDLAEELKQRLFSAENEAKLSHVLFIVCKVA